MKTKVITTIEDKPELKEICEMINHYKEQANDIHNKIEKFMSKSKKALDTTVDAERFHCYRLEEYLVDNKILPEGFDVKRDSIYWSLDDNAIKVQINDKSEEKEGKEDNNVPCPPLPPFIQMAFMKMMERNNESDKNK